MRVLSHLRSPRTHVRAPDTTPGRSLHRLWEHSSDDGHRALACGCRSRSAASAVLEAARPAGPTRPVWRYPGRAGRRWPVVVPSTRPASPALDTFTARDAKVAWGARAAASTPTSARTRPSRHANLINQWLPIIQDQLLQGIATEAAASCSCGLDVSPAPPACDCYLPAGRHRLTIDRLAATR
jgi:hypothetical protein